MFSLLAEERCGHLVTEDIKKLWSVQLELLKELQRICAKYNLKYYAIEGTLLGAIRHNGFIPWDDDIDVGMYSEDFDRFCQVVEKELPEYYEFQHFSKQDGMSVGISRIRDSRTTSCTNHEYNYLADSEKYNCGVFIDIFPLFGAAPNTLKRKIQSMRTYFSNFALDGYIESRKQKLSSSEQNENPMAAKCISMWNFLSKFTSYKKMAQKRYNALKMFSGSENIGIIGFYGYQPKFIWKKDWFKETVEIPFEDITISCPKEYDLILKQRYGDYNVFVKGTTVHTFACVDTETPYKIKLKEHYAEMQKKLNK